MISILNEKEKTSNLIKGISIHHICSGIKSQQVNKTICHSVPKSFDFTQKSSVPFHQVNFDDSISRVLLTDKPNESCQNSKKNRKKCHIHHNKKLLKRKGNSITPAKPQFHILLQNA